MNHNPHELRLCSTEPPEIPDSLGLTEEALARFRLDFESEPRYRLARNSCTKHDPEDLARTRQVEETISHHFQFKVRYHLAHFDLVTPYRWFSARLQYLQCVSNGDTAVLATKPSIWCQASRSTLVQVMAYPLFGTKPSHYLNQCWRIFTEYNNFYSRLYIWKSLPIGRFVQQLLTWTITTKISKLRISDLWEVAHRGHRWFPLKLPCHDVIQACARIFSPGGARGGPCGRPAPVWPMLGLLGFQRYEDSCGQGSQCVRVRIQLQPLVLLEYGGCVTRVNSLTLSDAYMRQ